MKTQIYRELLFFTKKIFLSKIVLFVLTFLILIFVVIYNIPYKKIYQEKVILPKKFIAPEIYKQEFSEKIINFINLSEQDKEYFKLTSDLIFHHNNIKNNMYIYTLEVIMNDTNKKIEKFFNENQNIYENYFSEKIGFKTLHHFRIHEEKIPKNKYNTIYEENIHHTGRINVETEDGKIQVNNTRCYIIAHQLLSTYKILNIKDQQIKQDYYKSLCYFNELLQNILKIKENSFLYNLLSSNDLQEYYNIFDITNAFNKNIPFQDIFKENTHLKYLDITKNMNENILIITKINNKLIQNIINLFLHGNDPNKLNIQSNFSTRIANLTGPGFFLTLLKLHNSMVEINFQENSYKYYLPSPYYLGLVVIGAYKCKLGLNNKIYIYIYPFIHFEVSLYFLNKKEAKNFRKHMEEMLKLIDAEFCTSLIKCWSTSFSQKPLSVYLTSLEYSL
jgi:hypothetical protein